MYPVFWTELAKETYAGLLQFLTEISLDAAIELDEKIERLEENLMQHRHACPPSPKIPRFRRCVVDKNTSLIYEVHGRLIFIVAVVDNRANHLYF